MLLMIKPCHHAGYYYCHYLRLNTRTHTECCRFGQDADPSCVSGSEVWSGGGPFSVHLPIFMSCICAGRLRHMQQNRHGQSLKPLGTPPFVMLVWTTTAQANGNGQVWLADPQCGQSLWHIHAVDWIRVNGGGRRGVGAAGQPSGH